MLYVYYVMLCCIISHLQVSDVVQDVTSALRSQGLELRLATNSPEAFVRRVFEALRLPLLPLHCPQQRNGWQEKPDARRLGPCRPWL